MKKLFSLTLLLCAMAMTALADVTVKATDPNISFTGRVQRLDNGSVRYDWVGVYLQTDFTGSSVSIRVSEDGESYHNVFIDGQLKGKIQITGKEPHDVMLADKLSKGTHRLRLQKCTEGEYGRMTVYSLTAKGKGSFKAVPKKDRFIEIIGDSYTCGYGTEGASEKEHFKLSTENCNKAYACLIANYFDADYAIVAHSGMGMARNYAGKTMKTMTHRYPLLFDDHDSIGYDFTAYKPDLVIINLGTNDFSVSAAPANYVSNYVNMIKTVRSHYGDVPVLCVTPHSANIYLLAGLRQLQVEIQGMKGVRISSSIPGIVLQGQDLGSDWHPNWKGQRKIAMTLIPQVSALTGWPLRTDNYAF